MLDLLGGLALAHARVEAREERVADALGLGCWCGSGCHRRQDARRRRRGLSARPRGPQERVGVTRPAAGRTRQKVLHDAGRSL